MDREILFKAKRLDNGEWVEGYLVKYPSAIQVGDCSPWYIQVPPVDPDDSGGKYNVDPSTVCQYTGLTDKNGNRIFEGDVVSYHHPFKNRTGRYTVEFAGYAFGCKNFYNPCYDAPWDAFSEGEEYFEVIGTVFDEVTP